MERVNTIKDLLTDKAKPSPAGPSHCAAPVRIKVCYKIIKNFTVKLLSD